MRRRLLVDNEYHEGFWIKNNNNQTLGCNGNTVKLTLMYNNRLATKEDITREFPEANSYGFTSYVSIYTPDGQEIRNFGMPLINPYPDVHDLGTIYYYCEQNFPHLTIRKEAGITEEFNNSINFHFWENQAFPYGIITVSYVVSWHEGNATKIYLDAEYDLPMDVNCIREVEENFILEETKQSSMGQNIYIDFKVKDNAKCIYTSGEIRTRDLYCIIETYNTTIKFDETRVKNVRFNNLNNGKTIVFELNNGYTSTGNVEINLCFANRKYSSDINGVPHLEYMTITGDYKL